MVHRQNYHVTLKNANWIRDGYGEHNDGARTH